MTLHARRTREQGDHDVLLVDVGKRRREVVRLIRESAEMHEWALFRSFSEEVPDDHRFEPSLRKRLTLKWKEVPGIRIIYQALLRAYLRHRDAQYRDDLHALLKPLVRAHGPLVVHAHTESHLRAPLMEAFPGAECVYFEHGQGDYIYILEGGRNMGALHALFARPFKAYLSRMGIDAEWVKPLDIGDDFPRIASELLQRHGISITPVAENEKPVVYILLEALDMYHVSDAIWGAYIEHVLGALSEPGRYRYVLKPHPRQSSSSLERTRERCTALGLDHLVLDPGTDAAIAVEVDFARWAGRVEHVFCLVSTGCFYLSQLYQDPRITYHYSTSFFQRWIGNAPPQYKRLFERMKPLIAEVLSERCVPY